MNTIDPNAPTIALPKTEDDSAVEMRTGFELHDQYVISNRLGKGGFAEVWRATDKKYARDVAIKRLIQRPGNDIKRLMTEANRTMGLRGHRNIVQVYEVFEYSGEGFLVMEYVPGASLQEILLRHVKERTWPPVSDAADYFRQILSGLLFAHSSGVYHRDVKPSNILVSDLGVVKLVDFGLARTTVTHGGDSPHGDTGLTWAGTPSFMSPEQTRGEQLDHLTDIFSAGIVGYLLFTGRHPFTHPSGIATPFALIQDVDFHCEAIEAAPGISETLAATVVRMLQKEKSKRVQSLMVPLTELAGEQVQACSRCGAENRIQAKFCDQCATRLGTPVVADESSVARVTVKPPDTPETLTDAGFELARDRDWEAAVRKYEQALALDPSYVRAYANLGYALNVLQRYEEAITVVSKGIELSTDPVFLHRLYDHRGFAKSNLTDYDGAIRDFSHALEASSNNPRVWHHRAESKALAAAGDPVKLEDAYADVLTALRLDPYYIPAIRFKNRLDDRGHGGVAARSRSTST